VAGGWEIAVIDFAAEKNRSAGFQPIDGAAKITGGSTFSYCRMLEFRVLFRKLRRYGIVCHPDFDAFCRSAVLGHVGEILVYDISGDLHVSLKIVVLKP
jgi:hypothetical protein